MSEKFGTYGEIISGYAFKSAELHDVDDIPVIKIGNISNGGNVVFGNGTQYVGKEFLEKIDEKFIVNNGDVLISLTGSHINQPNSMVGRSCRYLFDTPALLNQRAGKVFPKKNADGLYLYYLIHSDYFIQNIGVRAYGAANQANVSPNDIKKIKWNFPDLPTQTRIADILSAYDDSIENNDRRMDLLEKAAQELYKEWFVRFRFPGYESAKFVNGLPEGWEYVRFGTLAEIIDGDRGENYPKQEEFYSEGYCLFLNAGNVTKSGFAFENNVYITEGKDKALRKGKLVRNDIVLTTRGTVGNVAYYNDHIPYDVVRINSGMVILRDFGSVPPEFLYITLRSEYVQKMIELYSSGSAQPQLPIKDMRRMKILKPSKEIVEEFSKVASALLLQASLLQSKSQNLARQRDLLLPRLMSGKLEV